MRRVIIGAIYHMLETFITQQGAFKFTEEEAWSLVRRNLLVQDLELRALKQGIWCPPFVLLGTPCSLTSGLRQVVFLICVLHDWYKLALLIQTGTLKRIYL